MPARPRLSFGLGLAAGIAAVVLVWIFLGGRGDARGLEDDPGIPPPEYAYIDNARVLAYLAQIEGGLSASEKRTRRVTDTRTGGVAAGGVEVGGSSSRDEFVEEVVTPTATARFYRLLDRLGDKGYLRELNASARPASFASALGLVPEGFFVRIARCKLRVPTYVQMDEIITGSRGAISADRAWLTAIYGTDEEIGAAEAAKLEARVAASGGKPVGAVPSNAPYALLPAAERRLTAAAKRFAAAIDRNPRVPLASCAGSPLETPRKPDLLFPVELDALTRERSLLAGPVTIVGKVVRQVLRPGDVYVDRKAVAAYSVAVGALDDALFEDFNSGDSDVPSLSSELFDDVSVKPPGAVILPIAIYK